MREGLRSNPPRGDEGFSAVQSGIFTKVAYQNSYSNNDLDFLKVHSKQLTEAQAWDEHEWALITSLILSYEGMEDTRASELIWVVRKAGNGEKLDRAAIQALKKNQPKSQDSSKLDSITIQILLATKHLDELVKIYGDQARPLVFIQQHDWKSLAETAAAPKNSNLFDRAPA